MRRIRNRDQKKVLTHASEGEPPSSWGQRLTVATYMLGFATVAAMLVYFVGDRLLHFEVRGQIQVERTVVSAPRSGVVERLTVQEGDSVRRGDPLAVIDPSAVCTEPDRSRLRTLRADGRRDSLRQRIVADQIADKQAWLQEYRLGRVLELAHRDRPSLEDLRADIRELQHEGRMLTLNIELARAELDSLQASLRPDPRCRPYAVRAPEAGVMYALHRRVGEVVRSGDPLMTLQPPEAPVMILAYLEPDDLENVAPGKTVTVFLPDGAKEKAIVEATYSAARKFPQLKWSGYRAMPASLVAEIRPRSRTQAARWRELDLLDVSVKGDG